MKIKIIYYALPFLLTFAVWGCGNKSEKQQVSYDKSIETSERQESQDLKNTAPTSTVNISPLKDIKGKTDEKIPDIKDQRMIIKSGSLGVEVDKYDEAENKVNETVNKYIDPMRMYWVVVGDAKTQFKQLEKLGLGKPVLLGK